MYKIENKLELLIILSFLLLGNTVYFATTDGVDRRGIGIGIATMDYALGFAILFYIVNIGASLKVIVTTTVYILLLYFFWIKLSSNFITGLSIGYAGTVLNTIATFRMKKSKTPNK